MTRTTKVALLTLCLVLAVSSVSATAFTSITLDRDASVDVVADDAGLADAGFVGDAQGGQFLL